MAPAGDDTGGPAAAAIRPIDLNHQGRAHVIGAWLVDDVLIDPGPESCMESLIDGLGEVAPKAILLTHIHLDHAGATGSLASRFEDAEIWVHEIGAPHVVDPSRLLRSAARLYGEDMERLWGEVLPVPAERVRTLAGGERIHGFQVAYTPGHASHHVAYLHDRTGTAFCGDVAGVRIGRDAHVVAPTPPPDIDLAAWRESIATVERWRPESLVCTHYGRYEDVEDHLAGLRESLEHMAELARTLTEQEFVQALQREIAEGSGARTAQLYESAMPAWQCYAGLRRHLQSA